MDNPSTFCLGEIMNKNFGVEEEYSFKELYDAVFKATYNMKIGNREFESGEVIFEFDKITLGYFQEVKTHVAARGGYDNRAQVNWDETKEVALNFSQGVFSNGQFSMLSNAKVIDITARGDDLVLVNTKEELSTDENGDFILSHIPIDKIFVYNSLTHDKYEYTSDVQNHQKFNINDSLTNILVRYDYGYDNGANVIVVGRRQFDGYLRFEAKTRLKEDNDGRVVTGLLVIPHLKLMSDLSFRLGTQANPVVGNFSAVGYPIGYKGTKEVMDFVTLNDDLDADV